MKKVPEFNLFTGELLNGGDLREQLIIKLPLTEQDKKSREKYLSKSEDPTIENDIREGYKELLEIAENKRYVIFNTRGNGYQFKMLNANSNLGSFYHNLLGFSSTLDVDAVKYIVEASVYTLFSHSSETLSKSLEGFDDLNENDKNVLNKYIDRQVNYYYGKDCDFKDSFRDELLYETFFCKIEIKSNKLCMTLFDKEVNLPQSFKYFLSVSSREPLNNLIELIVRFELYKHFGFNVPKEYESKIGSSVYSYYVEPKISNDNDEMKLWNSASEHAEQIIDSATQETKTDDKMKPLGFFS